VVCFRSFAIRQGRPCRYHDPVNGDRVTDNDREGIRGRAVRVGIRSFGLGSQLARVWSLVEDFEARQVRAPASWQRLN
jgi:hypothetical protein